MTQLEILKLAYHQLLDKQEYYLEKIHELDAEGETHSIFDDRKAECDKKINEILLMICKEKGRLRKNDNDND